MGCMGQVLPRRRFIGVVGGIAVLAGCASSTDNENGNGNGNVDEEAGLEDFVELVGHEFKRTQVGSGILLEVTVENVSDIELGLIYVDSNIYVDDERVDDGGLTIADLPPGVTETDDMGLVDTSPDLYDQITHYEIVISTRNEEREEFEKTYEFDEFDYPPE